MNATLEKNKSRAQLAVWMLYICMGLMTISSTYLFYYYNKIKKVISNEELINEVLYTPDILGLIDGIFVIAFIVSAVTFVRWMLSSWDSIIELEGKSPFSREEVGWAFFIPIVNLYKPYQVIKYFWEEFQQLLSYHGDSQRENLGPGSVGLWWVLYLLGGVVSAFGTQEMGVQSDAYLFSTIIGDLMQIGSGFAIIQVIQQTVKWNEEIVVAKSIDEISSNVSPDDIIR